MKSNKNRAIFRRRYFFPLSSERFDKIEARPVTIEVRGIDQAPWPGNPITIRIEPVIEFVEKQMSHGEVYANPSISGLAIAIIDQLNDVH